MYLYYVLMHASVYRINVSDSLLSLSLYEAKFYGVFIPKYT